MCLRQIQRQIQRLQDDQKQREARGGRERVRSDGGDVGQRGPQRRAAGEGDAEAGAHHGHGRAALALVADIRRDGIGDLDVALTQATDDATGEKRAEIRRGHPQSHAEDVAGHGPQQRGAAAVLVGEPADDRRGDGLQQREERAQRAAQQDNVISGIDRLGEGVLVGVEVVEDAVQEGGWRGVALAVEVEQGGEEGEDKGEGDLEKTH